ncbi:MAG: ADP-ribosylglycohydrolase family protein [Lactobacillus sp.]|jgi:ADP-ribosylglycohydrolase|nr:ADP-ribosylglycohydrolase family protein [Lactobacillus sp.]MCI2032017.1 ADP-ribosylglycohydrolase family protein [Lactobacillus sp.]
MKKDFADRVLGVVLGTAYGDALGATIEKLSYEQIKTRYGEIQDIRHAWYKAEYPAAERNNRMRGFGIVTDDTLMTVALIQTYLKYQRHIDSWDMGKEFVRQLVYEKRYIPEFGHEAVIQDRLFYPEKYIFQRHVLANCEPREGGYGNMINCGAAMYVAPIGVMNAGNPQRAYDEAILFACGHQASYGLEAAGVLAACVAAAFIANAVIADIVAAALAVAKDGTKKAIQSMVVEATRLREKEIFDQDVVVNAFHQVMQQYSPMGDDVARREDKLGIPSDHYTPSRLYSIEELPMALGYLVLYDGDFKQAVIKAINSGRDTDSIGVMVSVICGAMQGSQIISKEDRDLLEEVNRLALRENAASLATTARKVIARDISLAQQQETVL